MHGKNKQHFIKNILRIFYSRKNARDERTKTGYYIDPLGQRYSTRGRGGPLLQQVLCLTASLY